MGTRPACCVTGCPSTPQPMTPAHPQHSEQPHPFLPLVATDRTVPSPASNPNSFCSHPGRPHHTHPHTVPHAPAPPSTHLVWWRLIELRQVQLHPLLLLATLAATRRHSRRRRPRCLHILRHTPIIQRVHMGCCWGVQGSSGSVWRRLGCRGGGGGVLAAAALALCRARGWRGEEGSQWVGSMAACRIPYQHCASSKRKRPKQPRSSRAGHGDGCCSSPHSLLRPPTTPSPTCTSTTPTHSHAKLLKCNKQDR